MKADFLTKVKQSEPPDTDAPKYTMLSKEKTFTNTYTTRRHSTASSLSKEKLFSFWMILSMYLVQTKFWVTFPEKILIN